MPWVRIDENAMDHPKFIALSANAWRLWCEGQSYCQKHLTDGGIPKQAYKRFRYYSPTSFKMLTAVLVPGKGSLWEPTELGVQVHDYLDYNDSREMVMRARREAQDRKRRWRDKHSAAARVSEGTHSETCSIDANGTRSETRSDYVVCSGTTTVVSIEGKGDARGKPSAPASKVTFDGSRLKVWAWQHEDLGRRLGDKAENFDLIGWYPRLNRELEITGESYADPWKWLQERLYRDADLPLPNLMGRSKTAGNKAALAQFLARGQG